MGTFSRIVTKVKIATAAIADYGHAVSADKEYGAARVDIDILSADRDDAALRHNSRARVVIRRCRVT